MVRRKFRPEPLEIVVAIGIVVILVAIIVACVHEYQTYIDAGTVIDKHYTSPYSTIQYINKTPVNQYHPGRYYITIRGPKEGKTVDYTFEVDDITYHKYTVGQQYP